MLTGERVKVLLLSLPEQKAPDVVVEEDRTHEVANVPGLPFKLTLKVRNNKPSLLEPCDDRVQADMIRLLGIFHAEPPRISPSSPSVSFSSARRSAPISS